MHVAQVPALTCGAVLLLGQGLPWASMLSYGFHWLVTQSYRVRGERC